MAWIESHQSLANHRKTLAVSRLLGVSRAQVIGHLHLLWWWALDNAPDGNISNIDPQDLARAADWPGDPRTLFGALTTAGFIDIPGQIHDWEEYAGRLEYHRLKNKEYQRRHREKYKQLLLTTSSNNLTKPDVRLTSALRKGATGPNSTQPNHIKKYIKKNPYGEFQNVFLSEDEYQKLLSRFNNNLPDKIEELSSAIESKGYKYKSHYATILTWARKYEQEAIHGTNRQSSTKLPDRHTGYTRPPYDPGLDEEPAAD